MSHWIHVLGVMFIALIVSLGFLSTSKAECVSGADEYGRPICHAHDPPLHAPDPIKKHQPEPAPTPEPERPSTLATSVGRIINQLIMQPLSGRPGASLGVAIHQDYMESQGHNPDTAGDSAAKVVIEMLDGNDDD